MKRNPARISFLGLGYVGLCTAAAFAAQGFKTISIDVDNKRIEQIRDGTPPFYEPRRS